MGNKELTVICTGLRDGVFEAKHTGRGADISPEFLLKGLSPAAKTLAVTIEDLSHPIRNFTHWVIWNIPASQRIEAAAVPGKRTFALSGATQGVAYGLHRYAGPKPPRGKRHQYRFTVYALDCRLALGAWAGKRTMLKSVFGHILQRGSVTGFFE